MKRVAQLAAAVCAVLAGALLLIEFRSVVLLVAGALVLAATVYPLGERVTRLGLPRAVAAIGNLLVTVAGLLLFLGISVYVAADALPQALADGQGRYATLRGQLEAMGGWQQTLAEQLPPASQLDEMLASLQQTRAAEAAAAEVAAAEEEAAREAAAEGDGTASAATGAGEEPASSGSVAAPAQSSAQRASGLLRVIVGTTTSVAGWLTQFILLVFIALYWSLERDTVERLWLSLAPAASRQRIRTTWRAIESELGATVRSSLIQVLVALLLLWGGLRLMGFPWPLMAAWIGSLLWVIPMVGWMMALPLIALIGLLSGVPMALGGAALAAGVYALLGLVVDPRLGGRRRAGAVTGLVVALALFESFGLLGLVIAAPLAAALHALVREATAPQATHAESQAATVQAATAQTNTVQGVPAPVLAPAAGAAQASAVTGQSGPSAPGQQAPVAARSPAGVPVVGTPVIAMAEVAPPDAAAAVVALRQRLEAVGDRIDPAAELVTERTRNLYAKLQELLRRSEAALQQQP